MAKKKKPKKKKPSKKYQEKFAITGTLDDVLKASIPPTDFKEWETTGK